MEKKLDDFEAVRILVQSLQGFEPNDQERIIRWAREKLGLVVNVKGDTHQQATSVSTVPSSISSPSGVSRSTNIEAFVTSKHPVTDKQFIATVAYYYRFEAPENDRKEVITAGDLVDACRKVNWKRLQPQSLVNTYNAGLIDKAERGAYRINAVGENLVAMTLPGNNREPSSKRKKSVTVQKRSRRKSTK